MKIIAIYKQHKKIYSEYSLIIVGCISDLKINFATISKENRCTDIKFRTVVGFDAFNIVRTCVLSSQKYFPIPKTRKIIRGNATGITKSRSHHRWNFDVLIGSIANSTFLTFSTAVYVLCDQGTQFFDFDSAFDPVTREVGLHVYTELYLIPLLGRRRANAVSELRFKYSFY